MTRTFSLKQSVLALSVVNALSLSPAYAATITVNVTNESDTACSLRNAVESINISQNVSGCDAIGDFGVGDAINFSVSTVNIVDGEISITSDMAINPRSRPVSISVDTASGGSSRVLNIRNANVAIGDVTLSGGRTAPNQNGGGLFARGSQLSLRNVVLTDNTADEDGGGLYVRDSTVTVDNSRFTNNSAPNGGGIFTRDSEVTIRDSIISGNTTQTNAGAGDDGGGLYVRAGSVSIRNSSIFNNYAKDEGGGVFERQSTLTISNSTISTNSATDSGGGIGLGFLPNTSLIHTTLVNNSAGRLAGGIAVTSGSLTLSNSLIAGNSAGDDGLNITEVNRSVSATINFRGTNLIGDSGKAQNEALSFSPPNSVILATFDSNQATPIGSIIGPLTTSPLEADVEVTPTHTLVINSPAIDAATNAICMANPISNRDQRRLQRTPLCDIGAFELGATEPRVIIPPILFLLLDDAL